MPQSPQDLPPQAQQMIGKLQRQQQQLQQLGEQRNQLRAQKMQIETALEALEEASEDEEVFKVAGPIIVKSTRDDLIEELEEEKEDMEVKLKSVEKKEGKVKEGAKKNQQELQEMLSGGQRTEEAG